MILHFADWSAGLWLHESLDVYAPPSALLQAQNVEYFSGGDGTVKLRGRRAKVRLNTDAPLAGTVRTLYRHYPRSGDPSLLIAFENSGNVNFKKDTNDDGIFEAVTGDFNAQTGQAWQIVNWPTKNAAYGVNGYNGLRKYDGSLTEMTLVSSAFAATGSDIGPYITVWKDRLWFTKLSELNYSVYATDINSDTTISSSNHLSLNEPKGGNITGLAPFGDLILLFKDSAIFIFVGGLTTGGQLTPFYAKGCVAPRTIQVSPHGVFYLARDGLFLTDGRSLPGLELSLPIRTLFVSPSGQTTYDTAIGQWYERKQQYHLKLDPSSATTYVLQRIETVNGPSWAWATFTNFAATAMATAESADDNGRLYLGDSAGKVWEADTGTEDDDDGTTSTIPILFQTPFVQITPEGLLGRAVRAGVLYRGKSTVKVEIRYDSDTAGSLTTIGWDHPDHRYQSWRRPITSHRHGRFISALMTLPTSSYETEFHTLDLEVDVRGPRAREIRPVG